MTELTRQIKRASMSHSLMNGYSLLLPRLAEENDERIKLLERENNYLREELTESRRANEHLFIELKRYKSLLRAKLPERELMLIDEIKKLREACASLYEFAMSEYPDGTELNFAHELRELGIEVPK